MASDSGAYRWWETTKTAVDECAGRDVSGMNGDAESVSSGRRKEQSSSTSSDAAAASAVDATAAATSSGVERISVLSNLRDRVNSLCIVFEIVSGIRLGIKEGKSAENSSVDKRDASRIESQENNPGVPHNRIESNLVSSFFDPGTSSFSTVDSAQPSLNTGELSNDREVRTTTFDESTNRRNDSGLSNLTTDSSADDDEVNPINGNESLTLPTALIGFQIQASSSLGSRIFDVVPILYFQRGNFDSSSSFNAARSTTTTTSEESSFASNSSG
ncbi:hypothetical protein TSAR_006880 [Trichomalopsis sarcophagae]|uniref:Uncharacterized protein n=1 Tax=Trichomalopsis sarcophagae TaxID=543379 RepID=A0A232FHA8_9HYME|nr:hypothetical protein TSAR_006880 [Trichomalopsis sarcophagae]